MKKKILFKGTPDSKNDSNQIEQHAIFISIILHLFPGAIATILYLILAPVLIPLGLPSILIFLIIAILILLPFELGLIIICGYRLHKKVLLEKVIFYR